MVVGYLEIKIITHKPTIADYLKIKSTAINPWLMDIQKLI